MCRMFQMRHIFLVSRVKYILTMVQFCDRLFGTLVFIGCDVVSCLIWAGVDSQNADK